MKKHFPSLAPATWIAIAALAVALAAPPAAFALGKNSVGSWHLKRDAVKSRHIDNGHVKPWDLRNRAVRTRKIAPGAVTGGKIHRRATGTTLATLRWDGSKVSNAYNRLGPRPTAEPAGATGHYEVEIPGANLTRDSILHVLGTTSGRVCQYSITSGELLVFCRFEDGPLAASDFNLTLVKE